MMLILPSVLALLPSIACAYEAGIAYLNSSGLVVNDIPYSTRVYWMKKANEALFNYSGPWCHYSGTLHGRLILVPYGHTGQSLSTTQLERMNSSVAEPTTLLEQGVSPLLVSDLNQDLTNHGEMNAIRRCVQVLTERGLTPGEISAAWSQLSLYTVLPV